MQCIAPRTCSAWDQPAIPVTYGGLGEASVEMKSACEHSQCLCGLAGVTRRVVPNFTYDGFKSPAAGPASGTVSPESHDAMVTISAWW